MAVMFQVAVFWVPTFRRPMLPPSSGRRCRQRTPVVWRLPIFLQE